VMKKGSVPASKKIWMIEGVISIFAGSVMCIAAPGNFIRKNDSSEDLSLSLSERILQMLKGIGEYLFPALLILAVTYLVYRSVLNKRLSDEVRIILICAALSYAAMILSPHYPDRAAFGTCVLIEICSVSMMKDIASEKGRLDTGIISCLLLISSVMVMFGILSL